MSVSRSPLVSVVIPAHNSGRFLAATLDSVMSQTVTCWECVVVDDRSTDDTLEIAQRYADRDPRFHVYRGAGVGVSAARNFGYRRIAKASAYVTFMDSDDVWLPHALATLLDPLENGSESVGAHGLADMIDAAGNLLDQGAYAARGRDRLGLDGRRLVRWPLDRPTSFAVLVNGNVLFPPGWFWPDGARMTRSDHSTKRLLPPKTGTC